MTDGHILKKYKKPAPYGTKILLTIFVKLPLRQRDNSNQVSSQQSILNEIIIS